MPEKKQFKQRNTANEKLGKFKIKIDSKEDMFGAPTEIPVAKDATSFNPMRGTAYGRSMAEITDNDQSPIGRIGEQLGQGVGKAIDGAFNTIK